MTNDKILTSDHVSHKKFSYKLEGLDISFVLRSDIKKELKAAKEILLCAIKDFDTELEKIK